MENIRGEVEKLVCYALDRDVVTAQDIETVCVRQIGSRIFDMVEAVADKKQKKAMELYYDLLTLKEPPMRILFLIARQFNLLLQVKELKNKGYDTRGIGEKVGLKGFIAGKYVSQAAKFKEAELKRALTDCVETEEAVKAKQDERCDERGAFDRAGEYAAVKISGCGMGTIYGTINKGMSVYRHLLT